MSTELETSPAATDDLRRSYGLTRSQWADLLKAHTLDEIASLYAEFIQTVMKTIDRELARPDFTVNGKPHLSTVQAARALGVGEFHLSNLRDRGKLTGTKHGRRSVYSREHLTHFLDATPDRHAAVASSFLRWLEARE